MFFLKKIFKKKLNIDEVEDLLYESGVEPKFADIIIQKIKTVKSDEEDLKKLIKKELFDQFQNKTFLLTWTRDKTDALLNVMEMTRNVALNAEIYW